MKKKLSFLKKPLLALSLAASLAGLFLRGRYRQSRRPPLALSGTMAISETSLRDVLLFTFDEINAKGGVIGQKDRARRRRRRLQLAALR